MVLLLALLSAGVGALVGAAVAWGRSGKCLRGTREIESCQFS
jgi:hypothetical protein